MNAVKHLLLLSVTALSAWPLAAQSKEELQEKKQKVQNEVNLTRQLLKETEQKKKQTLSNLTLISRLITSQNDLIGAIRGEIQGVEQDIDVKTRQIRELEYALEQEKGRLAKVLVQTYKASSQSSRLAFIFSSGSFNQAVSRVKYIRKLTAFQRSLMDDIRQRKLQVGDKVVQLEGVKINKTRLLGSEEKEKKQLEDDKKAKDQLAKSLQGKEKELRQKLAAQQKALKRLDNAIRNMIAKEMEEERRRQRQTSAGRSTASGSAERSGSTGSASAGSAAMTPEAREMSSAFSGNRGRLPWPVERGVVSQRFGNYSHPEIRGVTLVNNGVDISSPSGSQARSVFKGTVTAVLSIPGQENAVLVNHGEFFTVYSRLSKVLVNRGDKVDTRQALGIIFTDEEGKTALQFQVWQGQKVLDPQLWLAPR
jgi:septal ring factor EnvC (AmiA/AmiB activator)